MKRWAFAIVMASALPARADDDLAAYTRTAHDAAEHGFCDVVKETSEKVRALDPAYHEASFATDASIAACLAPEPPASPPAPPTVPSAPAPPAPTPPPHRELPPLSVVRIAGEVVVGGFGLFAGGYVSGFIALGVCSDDLEEACIAGIIATAIVGLSAGVHAFGSLGDQGGSFGYTLIGALAGALAGGIVGLVGTKAKSDFPADFVVPVAAISGALLGFNMSRHYDKVDLGVTPTAGGAALTLSTAW
jgi:hypothetical protein